MKIVSACLAGIKCRWDGSEKSHPSIIEWVKEGIAIPLCPEQLGGLTTPRISAEQKDGRVITKNKQDVTPEFERGAQEVLEAAKRYGCKEAVLKSKSPSCGCGKVYDGTFTGKLIDGDGVLTKKLKANGIRVITENDI